MLRPELLEMCLLIRVNVCVAYGVAPAVTQYECIAPRQGTISQEPVSQEPVSQGTT